MAGSAMFDDARGTITAVLGPTNTGKTHYALERMLARESGIIGLPLRLLAREIYDKLVGVRGPSVVALITGEEKIMPPRAKYFVCTVEAMDVAQPYDFVAIDEIQLCADPDRGHVFTERLLRARGRHETLFLGSDTMRGRIAQLVPEARFVGRERYSKLRWTGPKKISRLRPRTAVVAFSVDQVYAIAELIRRQRGGAAVVMGALSPRTRNAQVDLYQNGDVDYLIATDAIGMGLNMDVDHIAFAGTSKFDGRRHRVLAPNELAQIAGRAGRYTKDGTFGVTGEAGALLPETIEAIESHSFTPLRRLMWRNDRLDFRTVDALMRSLDIRAEIPELTRAREADDEIALRTLWDDPEIKDMTTRGDRVRQLWDICKTPDFRKVSPGEHAALLGQIYRFLLGRGGGIPSDWLAGQIRRLDRTDGDIDTLSRRLAFIRTWTYVANRSGWVDEAEHWRAETRGVEDRLSDALHAGLTQRFVDRRTSVLMRRLKQKERLVAEVNDKGEVTAEGQFLGRLSGFRFTIDETASGDELKALRSASLSALQAEYAKRADKLYLSPDTEIDLTEQGGLMWGTDAVGRLEKSDDPLQPKIIVFVDDNAEPAVREKVERRLTHWLARKINALFEPMIAMRDDEAITGLARGVAFRIAEGFGIVPRRQIADDVKSLAQEDRAMLRKHGVRFGQHFIFMPALLKPAPTRLRLLLWSLAGGHEELPEAPPPGHVTVPGNDAFPAGYYEMAGYRRSGARALRIDMLERLADLIRPMDARGGFEATQDMLSITGCTLEQFADLMGGLGFEAISAERPKTTRKPVTKDKTEGAPVTTDDQATDATPPEGAAEPAETQAVDGPAEAAPAAEAPPAPDAETPPTEAEPPLAAETDTVETADVSTEVSPEAPAEATADAETEVETFYTFRLAPRQRQGRRPQRGRESGDGGRQDGGKQDANKRDAGKREGGKNDGGKNDGAKRDGGKRDGAKRRAQDNKPRHGGKGKRDHGKDHDKPRTHQASPPRKEKPIDPDSPFAVLQKLKS